MKSPASDIAHLIAQGSLGVRGASSGWSIHVAVGPANIDTTIVLVDYEGDAPDTDELDLYRPRVQIVVRARSYDIAYSKQSTIRNLLKEVASQVVNGTSYLSITPIGEIISIGQDDNNRFVLTSNYQVLRT